MLNTAKITPSKKRKSGFLEAQVLQTLTSLPLGSLNITLPDGEVLNSGNRQGDIEANIHIKNSDFFLKGVLYGDIGFAEAYMDGDWDTDNIRNVISFFILNLEYTSFMSGSKFKQLGINSLRWINKIKNLGRANTLIGSKRNIAEHYDLGNAFYKLWLDKSMTYSSAYFSTPDMTLEEAQFRKYDRLCKIMKLKPEDHVLEIGCGWGANAIHMAKYYGCQVYAVTISEAQYAFAKARIQEEGLEEKINLQLKDYRKIEGKYNKIVSIEMLEAVGLKYFDIFFEKCNSLLTNDGLLAMQVITCPDSRFDELKKNVDFIQKHIFPGSILPSLGAINQSINKTGNLTLVDLKDFGLDYAKTLNFWYLKFNQNHDEIKKMGFPDHFIRKWNYYLKYCEAAFAMRNINVLQMLYSKPNNPEY